MMKATNKVTINVEVGIPIIIVVKSGISNAALI